MPKSASPQKQLQEELVSHHKFINDICKEKLIDLQDKEEAQIRLTEELWRLESRIKRRKGYSNMWKRF